METPKEELTSINESDLFATRLLCFLEEKSHTNRYRQVLLTKEQFKHFSDSICVKVVEKNGDEETVQIDLSDKSYTLPDLKEINR